MHDGGLITLWDVGWQPLDQGLKGADIFAARLSILTTPAGDLTAKIIAGAAKGFKADCIDIDFM